MHEEIINPVIVWVITGVFGVIAGALGWALKHEMKKRRESEAEQKAIKTGTRIFLRSQLRMIHERCVVDGKPMTVDLKEDATAVYEAYHALGGNGTGTRLYEEIMAQPIN